MAFSATRPSGTTTRATRNSPTDTARTKGQPRQAPRPPQRFGRGAARPPARPSGSTPPTAETVAATGKTISRTGNPISRTGFSISRPVAAIGHRAPKPVGAPFMTPAAVSAQGVGRMARGGIRVFFVVPVGRGGVPGDCGSHPGVTSGAPTFFVRAVVSCGGVPGVFGCGG